MPRFVLRFKTPDSEVPKFKEVEADDSSQIQRVLKQHGCTLLSIKIKGCSTPATTAPVTRSPAPTVEPQSPPQPLRRRRFAVEYMDNCTAEPGHMELEAYDPVEIQLDMTEAGKVVIAIAEIRLPRELSQPESRAAVASKDFICLRGAGVTRKAVPNVTTCRACGETVSTEANVCPHCGQSYPAIVFYCSKCKGQNVEIAKRGFSFGQAVVGGLLTGGVGLLAGALGNQNLVSRCLDCGFKGPPAGQLHASNP